MSIILPIVREIAPLGLNSSVLAVTQVHTNLGVLSDNFGHSGNEFDTVNRQTGAEPRATAIMPFWDAYNLIGWKSLKLTTLNIFEAKYVDALRQAGAVHRKYALSTSAVAHATIRSVSFGGPRELALAEVELVYLGPTGMTHPIATTDNNSLPALASPSAPTLHCGGMIKIDGTNYGALESLTMDTGNRLEAYTHAGDRYPTVCHYVEGKPIVRGIFADPVALLDEIGLEGQALAASPETSLWFRSYDASSGELLTTGIKIPLTYGRIMPDGDIEMSHRQKDRLGFRIESLADPSTPSTHPWPATNGQTLPT